MKSERLLLCRPEGGLNDILCQIGKACRYAERFGRTVIVDTKHTSTGFADAFSNYFVSTSADLVLNPNLVSHLFDKVSVMPSELAGRVTSYTVAYDAELNRLVDEESRVPLTFDFERDYDENLLVHQDWGGGYLSLVAIAQMRIHDAIVDILRQRVGAIGKPYDAIHIRDTDYKTDYRTELERLKDKLCGSVFVAADNRDALTFCRTLLGEDRVFSFANLPHEAGQPIHRTPAEDTYRRNRDAILDLMMLSLSENYYFFQLLNPPPARAASGFSLLAQNLKDKPELLNQILGRNEPIFDWQFRHMENIRIVTDPACRTIANDIELVTNHHQLAKMEAELTHAQDELQRLVASRWLRLGRWLDAGLALLHLPFRLMKQTDKDTDR